MKINQVHFTFIACYIHLFVKYWFILFAHFSLGLYSLYLTILRLYLLDDYIYFFLFFVTFPGHRRNIRTHEMLPEPKEFFSTHFLRDCFSLLDLYFLLCPSFSLSFSQIVYLYLKIQVYINYIDIYINIFFTERTWYIFNARY